MQKKISYLITGGFGLIGSKLTNSLSGNVTIVSRSEKHRERVFGNDLKVLIKNLNQLEVKDLNDIDVIYHCASTVDNYNVLSDPFLDVETNIQGTIRLLEICKNLNKKPKIIFPSTFFVYGNEYERTRKPLNEESKTEPLAIYPATKLCAESILKLYSRLYKIPYVICRLTNVYGENEEYNNKKKGALNYLIMQAIRGDPLSVYRGGNFFRDYIFVDDVVNALMLLETKALNDTYLIGYGKSVLFKDIIDFILKYSKSKSILSEIEPPDFHKIVGISNFVADISKIKKLGWRPQVDYKSGIKKVIDRYKSLS